MYLAVRHAPGLLAAMADEREPLRIWLKSIVTTKGATLSAIAKEAKVSQPTITRFVNDPQYPYELSARTIRLIETTFGIPAPRSRTFEDSSVATFETRAAAAAKTHGGARERIMAMDDALDLRGVRRGDLLEIDAQAQPRPGDVVQAELRAGLKSREMAVRIYDPPYLMAHSTTYELNRPILIEPGRARVLGVVTRVTRQLREPEE